MKKSMIILPIITASLVSAAYAGEMWNVENARSAVPSLSVEQQDGTYVTVVDGYRRLGDSRKVIREVQGNQVSPGQPRHGTQNHEGVTVNLDKLNDE